MADSNSEHLIRIIVQGVNRLGDVVEKGTRAVEKHTAALGKQDKAIDEGARTAQDAQEDYRNFTKAVAAGEKDYEAARLGLNRLAREMDNLAKKEPVGSKLSEDLNRSALNARNLAKQLDQSIKARLKAAEDAAKQEARIEADRQKEAEARAKIGAAAQEKILRGLSDLKLAEQEKIEKAEQEAQREREARDARGRAFIQAAIDEDFEQTRKLNARLDALDERDHQARLKRRVEEAAQHAELSLRRTPTPLGRGVAIDPAPRRTIGQRIRAAFAGGDDSQQGFISTLRGVDNSARSASSGVSRLEQTISRLSGSSDNAGFSIARVDNNLRGLVIVGVVAFSQQLISAFISLAAAALAVAAAAAQAGAAIGGALVAGIGQAIPAIGLLIAAFGRIGAVFDAVKLFNDQAAKAGYDQAQATDAQAAAADRVVSANEGVVAASQRVTDATNALTEAREKALQKIEDLNLAERRASLSQFEAGQAITRAIASGDVGSLEGLRNRRDEANVTAGRSRVEASEARAAGVDRAPEVLAAAQNLEQANASLRAARREADAAGRAATRAATAGSAADRALEQALAQLTPAELALYETAKRFQTRFRELFRPVTDIIVRAFTRGVDRASEAMEDSRVLETVRGLAKAIAGAMDAFTTEATSEQGLNFFKVMGDESARNIPLLTTLAIRIQRIMAAIAVAGGPAFRKFIEFFNDLAKRGEEATNSQSGLAKMERFFLRGEEMAESFLKLGGAIIMLFAAIAGAGGAEEGISLVDDLTASIQRATVWVQKHQDQVREFFADAGESTRAIAGAIFAIAKALLSLFASDRVVAFTDAFREVLLPALTNVAQALGTITFLMTKFLSLPGVSQIAQIALSVGLLFKAFSVLGKLLLPFAAGLIRVVGPMSRIGPIAIRMASGLRIAAAALAGPIGLAIAAIITAIVILDRKFHFIRPTIRALGEAWEWLSEQFMDGLETLKPVAHFIGVVLAGAFDFAREAITTYLDVWLGFITTVLGGLSTLASIGSKLPGVGGKFKGLADFIDGARDKMDGFRESLRNLGDDSSKGTKPLSDMQDRVKTLADSAAAYKEIADKLVVAQQNVNKAIKDGTSPVSLLRLQVRNLTGRLSLLDSGSQEYKDTAVRLREKQRELNGAMADAGGAAKKGRRGIKTLGDTAEGVAKAIDAANLTVVESYNQLYSQLGSGLKKLVYRSGSGPLGVTKHNPALAEDKATGGWITRKGGPQGPDNRLIRAGDGEAVLAVPHQPIVEQALKLRSAFMGGPSTLDEMFSRVKGYVGAYATGGRVGANFGGHPTNVNASVKRLIALMQSKFPLSVTSTTDHSLTTTSGNPSDHPGGNAVDLSGATAVMFRAAEYIKSSGLYKRLKQGIHNPNLAVNRGVLQKPPGQFAGAVWAQHADHLHLAITGAIGKLAAGTLGGLASRIREPRISGPRGSLRDFAQRAVHNITRAANRKLEAAAPDTSTLGGVAASLGGKDPVGDILILARRAAFINRVRWNAEIVKVLLQKESSGGRNLGPSGPLSATGPFQVIPSTFAANALRGHKNIRDPYDNALAAFHYIKGRYGSLERLAAVTGLFGGGYRGYEHGGKVAGRGPVDATLHGDEHVWTAREVAKAGGHRVMYALRKMLGGGGQGADSYEIGGRVLQSEASLDAFARKLVGGIVTGLRGAGALRDRFSRLSPDIGTRDADRDLGTTTRSLSRIQRSISRLRTRGSNFVQSFERSLRQITDDQGLLDQSTGALDRLVAGMARGLKRLSFRVRGSGLVVRRITAQQEADAQTSAIDRQLRGLQNIRGTAADSLSDVDKRLRALRRGGVNSKERKAYDTLRAARNSLVSRIEGLDGQIADAIESRFAAQERSLQVAIEEINATASRANARADIGDRIATLFDNLVGGSGVAGGIRNTTLGVRQDALVTQRNALAPLLAAAQAQGNTSLVNELIGQIEELNIAIAENSAAISQNTVTARQTAIDAIARTASRAGTRADLADRVASLLEAAGNSAGAFSLRGSTLLGRRDSITSQRDSLLSVLADAQNNFTGTVAQQQQIEDLIDQIADLNVQLDENSQAIEQNTTAARQARIDTITGRGGFLGGVFGGLSGIVKALGALAGQEDVNRIAQIAQAAAIVLAQTGAGLRDELLAAFGIDLRGLDPSALVSALGSLDFDSIETSLSVEQRNQFRDLINAIIENAGAVVDNTQQLADLNGTSGRQSFSSSAWELFREAIFNGSGGLMPQYRFNSTMPQPITNSANANLVPAGSTQIGGDTYVVQTTSPTEIADPAYFAQVLSFHRSTKRAT